MQLLQLRALLLQAARIRTSHPPRRRRRLFIIFPNHLLLSLLLSLDLQPHQRQRQSLTPTGVERRSSERPSLHHRPAPLNTTTTLKWTPTRSLATDIVCSHLHLLAVEASTIITTPAEEAAGVGAQVPFGLGYHLETACVSTAPAAAA